MEESKHIKLNKEKWNKWSEVADGKGWIFEYLRSAQMSLISLLDLKGNLNFLDVGCGTGWAVGEAAKTVNYQGSFYGIDMSEGMIEKAIINFRKYDNLHFIQASSESVPLADSFFDTIICTNSFHHYLHPVKAMNEIYRLLRTGGKIYILDPAADLWVIRVADKIFKLFEPQHVKMYSTEEFRRLMTDAGLTYKGYKEIRLHQKVQIGEKQNISIAT